MTEETPIRPAKPGVWVVTVADDADTSIESVHQTPAGACDAAREVAADHRYSDWEETERDDGGLRLSRGFVSILARRYDLDR